MFDDLREFLKAAEQLGEIKFIRGADCDRRALLWLHRGPGQQLWRRAG